jgi:hypothetical protein
VTLRGKQLLVGTDVGAFASTLRGAAKASPRFGAMQGLPSTPVSSITLKPGDYDTGVVALMGRGVWTYRFDSHVAAPPDGTPSAPVLGTPVATYDFESGAQGWTTGGTPTWQRGTPGHGSGTQEAAAGNAWSVSGPTGYLDNMDATLTSPAIALPAGRSVVQFAAKVDTEAFDPTTLEWSSDGSTWRSLTSYAGTNPDNPGWTTYSALLPAPGGDVQVRFHFTSDAFCSGSVAVPAICADDAPYDGVHVDDVKVGPAAE